MKLYRHKKRGTEYGLVGSMSLQMSVASSLKEGDVIAGYISADNGGAYSRPVAEFCDGRFELVGCLELKKLPLVHGFEIMDENGEKIAELLFWPKNKRSEQLKQILKSIFDRKGPIYGNLGSGDSSPEK